MKVADIKSGDIYRVHLSERTSMIYGGCDVDARVVRAGFSYDVEVVTGSMIRGAPFKRSHRSEYPTGVEIEWDAQEVSSNRPHERRRGLTERVTAGRATINCRNVLALKENA